MQFQYDPYMKSWLQEIYIRRGSVGYGAQGGGFKIVLNTDGIPRIFTGLVSLTTETADFMQRFQSNKNIYKVIFNPIIGTFTLSGQSTNLLADDQLILKNTMSRTAIQASENENDHLIRDIRNTNNGVLTITSIKTRPVTINFDEVYCEDITSAPGLK